MKNRLESAFNNIFTRKNIKSELLIMISLVLLLFLNSALGRIEKEYAASLDISRKKMYTLSGQTYKTIDSLDGNIYIYNLYLNEDPRINEILSKYSNASSKITLLNITNHSELPSGIENLAPGNNVIVITNEDGSLFEIIDYEDLYLYENDIKTYFRAENKLTASIEAIDNGAIGRVKFITGHGETSLSDLSELNLILNLENYSIESYDLSASSVELDPLTDVVVVIAPKADFEESEFHRVMNFMNHGGRAVFYLDRVVFNTTKGIFQKYTYDLPFIRKLFSAYGLDVSDNVIMSDDLDINLRRSSIKATIPGNTHSPDIVVNEATNLLLSEKTWCDIEKLLVSSESSYLVNIDEEFNGLATASKNQYVIAALSVKNNSKLALISDSTCISNECLNIEGNEWFLKSLMRKMTPVKLSVSVPIKKIDIPEQVTENTILSVVLSVGYLAAVFGIAAAVFMTFMKIDRRRRDHIRK